MGARLLRIGEFAELTGLSIRALRLYDELSLLNPTEVNDSSHYRYYSIEQLQRGASIGRLRRLRLPLAEIKRFLESDLEAQVRILHAHIERLKRQVDTVEVSLHATEDLVSGAANQPLPPST
jgi:DNA-binding transcriptional MerR regulator